MISIIVTLDQKLILKTHFMSQGCQKFNPLGIFPKLFGLPDTDTVGDFPMKFANQSKSSLHFNQSQASNRKT